MMKDKRSDSSGEQRAPGPEAASPRRRHFLKVAAIGAAVGYVAPKVQFAHAQAPSSPGSLIAFTVTLDVAQATTAQAGASGSGTGTCSFDPSTKELSYNITYSGLAGTENNAHFHLGAVGVAGGVEIGLPAGSPKVGTTVPLSAQQEADLLADLWYVNIHSDHSSGGEIRGQVIQA